MKEGKQARELSKLHRTSARPGGAASARLRPPAPGYHLRPSALLSLGGRPPSRRFGPGDGDPENGPRSRELRAFSSRGAGAGSHLSPGLERHAGELASRHQASPPGFGHPPAFSVTQVQENSESLQSAEWRGGGPRLGERRGLPGSSAADSPFPASCPVSRSRVSLGASTAPGLFSEGAGGSKLRPWCPAMRNPVL